MVRMPPEQLASVDAWIAEQPVKALSRPAAIRRLIDMALQATPPLSGEIHR